MKFVIASTGRSGLGYISKVLRNCGIDCGHEEYFVRNEKHEPNLALDGDSSVWSVPHLANFNGIIIHQLRHPLKVLTSLMHDKEEIKRNKDVWNLMSQYMPQCSSMSEKFMYMIYEMNSCINHYSHYTFKVEEVTPTKIAYMASFQLGYDVDIRTATNAYHSTSKSYNSYHNDRCLRWKELRDCHAKRVLKMQALLYGYEE